MALSEPLFLSQTNREQARAQFLETWAETTRLFSALRDEASFLTPPPHRLRFPLIFYYAHPAAFTVNKLRDAGCLKEDVHPGYQQLFATGVDENSWDDMNKTDGPWPTLAQVEEFRSQCQRTILKWIETTPELDGRNLKPDSCAWALIMGIEHEKIHLETTSVLMRELPIDVLKRPETFAPLAPTEAQPLPLNWIPVQPGRARLGRPENFDVYYWDNEDGHREEVVPEFLVSDRLITNGDFLAFVEADGYETQSLWSEEGWAWRNFRKQKNPSFWSKETSGKWKIRTLFELIDLPLSWPVIVNHHEAQAYAKWRSQEDGQRRSLPTEAQLRHLIDEEHPDSMDARRWFGETPDEGEVAKANVAWKFSSESPALPLGHSPVIGNVWQWCEDEFKPLEGFKTHPLYPDYSTPSFDGKHRVLLGGSFATSGAGLSPWVRNAFRPHFFQHAGFRLISSKE